MKSVLPAHFRSLPLLCLMLGHGGVASSVAQSAPEESTRIVALLVSERAEESAKGEAQLSAQQPAIIQTLLERIRSGGTNAKGRAAYELALIISPWVRGKEAGERFYSFTNIDSPKRPVERPIALPEAPTIRNVLQNAIEGLSETNPAGVREQASEATKALYEALGEVADDTTMDWVLRKLEKTDSPSSASHLFEFAEGYLGIPRVYEVMLICGNSSDAERKAFLEGRIKAVNLARESLHATWQKVRPMDSAGRIKFSIQSWRDKFVSYQQSYSGSYNLDRSEWIFREMEGLIRFGSPALALLRAQQAQEQTLEARGVWEVLISAIEGKEDEKLMRELLAGRDPHLYLVAEIVAASGSKNWLPELESLQQRTGIDSGRFSQAIFCAHREAGIPALKKGVAWNKSNYQADCGLQELAVRAEKGSPPHMRRYQFQ